jgi:hypothetical protein
MAMRSQRLRQRFALLLALLIALTSLDAALAAVAAATVIDQAYIKANGRPPDAATIACSTNNRQQNEPTVAINPTAPTRLTSGANEYCTVPVTGNSWAGFYYSADGGANWTNSLLPGYPGDASPEGLASPLQQAGITGAGDPVQAWDTSNHLYYAGIAFNRTRPASGSLWVARYT